MRGFLATTVMLGCLALVLPGRSAAQETEHEAAHHLAVFIGGATETKRDKAKDLDIAVGVDYEYRLTPMWGVGGMVEYTGGETERNIVALALVNWHPWRDLRIVVGPGIEFPEGHENEFVFRIGAGWEFPVGGAFSLTPEFNADFLKEGKITYVYGVAVGIGF